MFCVYSDEVQFEGVGKTNIGVSEEGNIDSKITFDLSFTIDTSEEESESPVSSGAVGVCVCGYVGRLTVCRRHNRI